MYHVSVKTRLSKTEHKIDRHDTFAGGKIVRWNRDTGERERARRDAKN